MHMFQAFYRALIEHDRAAGLRKVLRLTHSAHLGTLVNYLISTVLQVYH